MNNNEKMIKSKNKRLKHLRERENKVSNENTELRELNEAMKDKVLSKKMQSKKVHVQKEKILH